MSENEIIEGIKKIRRTFAKRKNTKKASKALSKEKDSDVRAVLQRVDPLTLLKKLKKTGGPTNSEYLEKIGLGEESDSAEGEDVVEDSDGVEEFQLHTPNSIGCDDKDEAGNDIIVVSDGNGLYGCASKAQR